MRDEFPSQPPDSPAERPVRQPSRPYGVRPAPASLVRDPASVVGTAAQEARSGAAATGTEQGPAPSVSDDLNALIAATEQEAWSGGAATGTKQEAPASAADAATEQEARPAPPAEVPVPAAASIAPGDPREDPAGVDDEDGDDVGVPSPLRPRQEAFCHYFVLYGNATTAAAEAGYAGASCKNQGYRLLRRPAIRARIAGLRAGLASAYALDADVLLGKLEALYQRAVEDHHFHAAARAVELQARIAGHVESRARLLRRAPLPKNGLPSPKRSRSGFAQAGDQ